MITVRELKKLFCVEENKELAEKLGRSPQAVSNWEHDGVPAAIERKVRDMFPGISGSETKKAELTPFEEQILGLTDKMSPEDQAVALKSVMEVFISSQTKGK